MPKVEMPNDVYLGIRSVAIEVLPDNLMKPDDAFATYEGTSIRLGDQLTEVEKGARLLHELIHAIFHESGAREVITDKQEELITSALSLGLFILFRDNLALAEWFSGVYADARTEIEERLRAIVTKTKK